MPSRGKQKFGVASNVRHLAALQAGLSAQSVALADFTGPEEALRDLMRGYANQVKWDRSAVSESQDQGSRHPRMIAAIPAGAATAPHQLQ